MPCSTGRADLIDGHHGLADKQVRWEYRTIGLGTSRKTLEDISSGPHVGVGRDDHRNLSVVCSDGEAEWSGFD